ncbi:MAG: hypothetical protein JWR08_1695 [Enterovirga sp.]|jgi:hypothetical protein|nr:hypothetical protein [Enterovirga sp.]
MTDRSAASLQELVGDALKDAASLAQKELKLFRAEMTENLSGFLKGAGMFAAAAVFAVASLIWLTQALVYGLELIIHSRWLSALIVGAGLALVAGAFILAGKSMISAASLTPSRTVRSLKRDGDILAERTS